LANLSFALQTFNLTRVGGNAERFSYWSTDRLRLARQL
jgi:hypothetical protein